MKQVIPKIIHQIWSDINDPLPEMFRAFGQTWKDNHPDWKYEFWDEERMNCFVRDYYPQYMESFSQFSYNVQRWDTIRYLFLYQMGGMYVDFDSECFEPLDELLAGKTCCFSLEPEEHGKVFDKKLFFNNALIAVVPKHPFIKIIIDHVFNNQKKVHFTNDWNKGIEVQESTGPLALVRLYESYPDKDGIYLIPAEYVSPFTNVDVISFQRNERLDELERKLEKACCVHYFMNTWSKGKNKTT